MNEDIKYLTKIDYFARWSFLLYINCINSFTVHKVIQLMIEINYHSIRSKVISCIKETPF